MSARSVLTHHWLFALVPLLALQAPIRAADDDVHISVVSILATTKNSTIDPRVSCVATQMQKIDPKLTGFSVARMTCKDVTIGNKDCFEIVDGQKVCVTAEKRCEKDPSRVCLKVEAPTLGAITYQTCCGKFFPLVTRYKNKNGDLLIVAVQVKTCKDE
jgi:hypothetical protein